MGPHTIDRFSSFCLRQLPRFNSCQANPCFEDVDAFSFGWDNENNWLFPPIIPTSKTYPKSVTTFGFFKSRRYSNCSRTTFSPLVALGISGERLLHK